MENVKARIERDVVRAGICTGCGACVALDRSKRAMMVETPAGPVPHFPADLTDLTDLAWRACPGKGVAYPDLYRRHFGKTPESWLLGNVVNVRTGYSSDPEIRRRGASGGVITHVLTHLLETKQVDAAIVVQQGLPEPDRAQVRF